MRYLANNRIVSLPVVLIALVLILMSICGCGCGSSGGNIYNYTVTTPVDTSETNLEPTFASSQNPSISVAIDYFGIKSTHQLPIYIAPNRIQLYIVVDDGKNIKRFTYPYSEDGIVIDDFHLENLGQQILFETPSVGDYIRISVLAYSCEDKEAVEAILEAFQAFEPSIETIKEFYQLLPQSEELIGWYEHTWYSSQNWGATPGKYEAVGSGDLRLWFRIWSDDEPEAWLGVNFGPEVYVHDVALPSDAKPGWVTYPITLSLENKEQMDIRVKWEAYSSITGKFDSDFALIPKNSSLDIKKYYFWEAGSRTITYKVYYENNPIDTWSGTLNVVP